MGNDKCPGCGAGFSNRPHKWDGWDYAECNRRWHPERGWESSPPPECLRRQLTQVRDACTLAIEQRDHERSGRKACETQLAQRDAEIKRLRDALLIVLEALPLITTDQADPEPTKVLLRTTLAQAVPND